MSKQISAQELAEIVTRLLTETETTGELDSQEAYRGFMTDLSQLVCDYCGGEVRYTACLLGDTWYIGIFDNETLPEAPDGIWREYDLDGEL